MPTLIDMETLLGKVMMVYESRLRAASIATHIDLRAQSKIRGLRGELHQVLSNLISNAIDAISSNGDIWITLEDSQFNEKPAVFIKIEDNGRGIPKKNLTRLFEPFFTTKLNSGTGLGLWVVKQFVSNWGGQISVESSTENNNHGTAFNLFVPLVALSNPRSQSTETAPTTK